MLMRLRVPVLESFYRLLHALWEVGHLVNLANLDHLVTGHGRPLCPFDGFFG